MTNTKEQGSSAKTDKKFKNKNKNKRKTFFLSFVTCYCKKFKFEIKKQLR